MQMRSDAEMVEMEKLKKKNEKLHKMVEEAREKAKAYEQIAEMHSACITNLLMRLGATNIDNGAVISKAEITEAMEHYETRAGMNEQSDFILFCADKESEEPDGVREEAAEPEGVLLSC